MVLVCAAGCSDSGDGGNDRGGSGGTGSAAAGGGSGGGGGSSGSTSGQCATTFPGISPAGIAPLDCLTGSRVLTLSGDEGASIYDGTFTLENGDWSGRASLQVNRPTTEVSASGDGRLFDIEFSPDGATLVPGQVYQTDPNQLTGPYLYLTNNGAGCLANGRFQVFEQIASGEAIQCLTVTFEYICDSSGLGVRGCLHTQNLPLP